MKKLMRPAKGSDMVLKTYERRRLGVGDFARHDSGDGHRSSLRRHCRRPWRRGSHGCTRGRQRFAFDRRGRINLEKVEQMIGGDVGPPLAEEDRENAVLANGLVERGDEMMLQGWCPSRKYSSISSSLPSATSSTRASWRCLGGCDEVAGISPILPRPSPPGV